MDAQNHKVNDVGPKVSGLGPVFKNTTLEFNSQGLLVKVSVNITPAMARVMSPNNVFKGPEGIYIYRLQKQLTGSQITSKGVMSVQGDLLNKCMILARKAKLQLIHKSANNIDNKLDLLVNKSKGLGLI